MTYWSFLSKFVFWSATAFGIWAAFLAKWYVTLLVTVGPYLSAVMGYGTQVEGSGRDATVYFIQGSTRIPYGLHLETASLGLLPFLALIGATASLSILRRVATASIGTGIFIAFHLTLFAAYPFFLTRSGLVVDSLGAFWALLVFGFGFPFLLWLTLIRTMGRADSFAPEARPQKGRGDKAPSQRQQT